MRIAIWHNLPSGGACAADNRISPSEMCYAFLQLNNYPGSGTITQNWGENTGRGTFVSFSNSIPARSGSYWWSYVWSYIGHFSWEINRPGSYYIDFLTTWGNANIEFTVVDTSCPPMTVTTTII